MRFDITHLASPPVIRLDRILSLRTLWTRRGNRDDVRVSIRINRRQLVSYETQTLTVDERRSKCLPTETLGTAR